MRDSLPGQACHPSPTAHYLPGAPACVPACLTTRHKLSSSLFVYSWVGAAPSRSNTGLPIVGRHGTVRISKIPQPGAQFPFFYFDFRSWCNSQVCCFLFWFFREE
ncbi:hypothetical protein M758_3G176600 [Ceratodon purpureus]|uniref:Uncharacterized protein n=1 Tax=Ceratodon purpureus TaxID=3225 RepID=A0A8T0ILL2_CERPU|nr:hypothetical protein KC19_3G171400 [Ceratodon purpureus]KAG0623468.1 hypothetical protein M758_3G176600 [Ceratodon purpureus]